MTATTRSPIAAPLRRFCAAAFLATAFLTVAALAVPSIDAAAASLDADRRIGAAEHPKAVEAFGGLYKNDDLQRYIASIGELLVKTSEYPDEKFTFVVLDSDIVNA